MGMAARRCERSFEPRLGNGGAGHEKQLGNVGAQSLVTQQMPTIDAALTLIEIDPGSLTKVDPPILH